MSDVNATPSAQVREAADKLKVKLTVVGGEIVTPENLFQDFVGGDKAKLAEVVESQKSVVAFTHALSLAGGELGIEAMAKDKELQQVSFKSQAGQELIEGSIRRNHNASAGIGKGRVDVHGHLHLSSRTKGVDTETRRISKFLLNAGKAALAG